ncbi:rhodanese-like domain-containing protein [Lentibacillus sp. Marseille-P4043]|uniref:rhodanese-like domain-containing protein n=1 Tax=Lentibacillus sp. Marseille-P4043 TaxID=2040293 RepID=UPI000D0AF728|nr:rhodanese-like domain-containing protein [Lentibacillus sp. Marseille-P4043]
MDHINELTPHEVEEVMEKDTNAVIIDVREDEEVAQGMIEHAKHIPLNKIPQAIKDLDKNKHYVLVCRSGGRSMNAALYMDEHGFNVSSMAGGMLEWDGEVIL